MAPPCDLNFVLPSCCPPPFPPEGACATLLGCGVGGLCIHYSFLSEIAFFFVPSRPGGPLCCHFSMDQRDRGSGFCQGSGSSLPHFGTLYQSGCYLLGVPTSDIFFSHLHSGYLVVCVCLCQILNTVGVFASSDACSGVKDCQAAV